MLTIAGGIILAGIFGVICVCLLSAIMGWIERGAEKQGNEHFKEYSRRFVEAEKETKRAETL